MNKIKSSIANSIRNNISYSIMASDISRRDLRSTKRNQAEYLVENQIENVSKVKIKNNINRKIIKLEYEDEKEQEDRNSPKSWKPLHWEDVYEAILEMRSKRDAAVDDLGAEKCSDKESSPKVQRFHTLIGLMLSSQTKDNVTHAAVMRLKDHGLTVENILSTPESVIEKIIYPVGFYKKKANYIKRTCEILKEKYDCDIPPTVKELCALPGVGNKMAYLCMDIAWDKMEGIGVDTHVHRICNRLGWASEKGSKTPEGTRKALEEWLPKEYWSEVSFLLVGFGQQICLPVGPKCGDCLAREFCPFGSKTANKKPRGKAKEK